MSKAYTTSTASISVPVMLSFTCPKCGQYGTVNRGALLSAQATMRGYNNSGAGMAARQKLAASADSQIDLIVERLEKGQVDVLQPAAEKHSSRHAVCPHCGIRQVVDDGRRRTLYPKAFALKLIGLFVGVAFASGLIVGLMGQSRVSPGVITLVQMLCIIAVVAAFFYNKGRSNKAYSAPALMEKRYHSVLNSHMEATLMLGIGNVRHVSIPTISRD